MSPVALVVDDSTLIRHMVCRCLEARGFEVQCASNGREALELLTQLRPNVIITDLEMPEMGGDELITALKNKAETVSIPVVILTSRESRGAIPQERANFVIYKNIDIGGQLYKALSVILGKGQQKKAACPKK